MSNYRVFSENPYPLVQEEFPPSAFLMTAATSFLTKKPFNLF